MFLQHFLLLFVLLSGCTTAYSQGNIKLVTNSKSAYTIIVPAAATDIEKKAATTLQKYITQISKCVLPIESKENRTGRKYINIGRTTKVSAGDTSGLGEDGILIKQKDGNIILTGGPRKGVLYSVYTFLEDYLGCHAYTSDNIQVPVRNSIELPVNIYKKQTPSFGYRMTFFPDALNSDYCDWRKLNYFTEDWGLWVHSFEGLLPKEQFFATHPEYYALVNGKRKPTQPDLTNPNVLRIVIDHLKKIIPAKPSARYWSVSQNDNQDYCECVNCTRLNEQQKSPQGSLLTFVNAVAKNFPDKIITTLAYGYSEKPPLYLKPEKNVMIMFTAASITQRQQPIINQNSDFNNNLIKWGKICNHLFLWDYTVQFEHSLLPFPNLLTLQPNIKLFGSNNVKYLFEQGSGPVRGEFSELKTFLLSKLMWNKNINVQATTDSFLNYYYGKTGAQFIREYITALNKNANGNLSLYTSGSLDVPMNTYLSYNNINVYKSIFNRAFNVLDPNSVYGKRVLKEYCCVLYGELENIKNSLRKGNKLDVAKKAQYKKLLSDWYGKAKAANLQFLSEGKLSVEDYQKSYVPLLSDN